MSAQLSRRELTALAFAGAAAAQTTSPEPTDEAVAKQRTQANIEALERFKIPMSTEPAFQFKA